MDELEGIYDRTVMADGLAGEHDEVRIRWHVKGNLFLTGYQWGYDEQNERDAEHQDKFNFDLGRDTNPGGFRTGSFFTKALCVRGLRKTSEELAREPAYVVKQYFRFARSKRLEEIGLITTDIPDGVLLDPPDAAALKANLNRIRHELPTFVQNDRSFIPVMDMLIDDKLAKVEIYEKGIAEKLGSDISPLIFMLIRQPNLTWKIYAIELPGVAQSYRPYSHF